MSGGAPAPAISCIPATPAARDEVVALWTRCGLTRPWNDPVADFDAALEGPASAVLVLREEGRMLATVMVGHDGHPVASIISPSILRASGKGWDAA